MRYTNLPSLRAFLVFISAAAPAFLSAQTIQARRADAFVDSMGINVHMESPFKPYSNYSLINQELPALGMRHFRDEINDTDSSFVYEINFIGTMGYSLCGLIEGGNDYPGRDKRLDASLVVPMIANLLPTIDAVEGPNEPDDKTKRPFAYDGVCKRPKETKACYPQGAVRESVDLWNIVKHSDVVGSSEIKHLPVLGMSEGDPRHFADLVKVTGENFADATYGNMHAYQGGLVGDSGLAQAYIPDAQLWTGEKLLWTTEMGYHNYTKYLSDGEQQGVSERASAIYLPIAFLSGFNHGVLRTFSYELNDEVDDPDLTHVCGPSESGIDYCSGEGHYGLLGYEGHPKPAFTALQNLIELLREPGSEDFKPGSLAITFSGAPSTMEYTLLEKSTGDYYLAIWNDLPVYQLAALTQNGVEPGKDLYPRNVRVTLSFSEAETFTVYAPNDASGVNPTSAYTVSSKPNSIAIDLPAKVLLIKIVSGD